MSDWTVNLANLAARTIDRYNGSPSRPRARYDWPPRVTFRQVDPVGSSITVPLLRHVAVPTGDGGWSVTDRPRRKGITEWTGQKPYTMPVQVYFDGFVNDRSVEAPIEVLRLMQRQPKAGRMEPAVISISGPVPLTRLRWVIDTLDFNADDEIYNEWTGERVRSSVTVGLLEYVGVTLLPEPVAAAQEAAAAGAGTSAPTSRIYTVKRGDTLSTIAARELGKASRWPEIVALNVATFPGLRDPNRIQVGWDLRLP